MIHLSFEQIGDDFFAYRRFHKRINPKYERRKWQMTKERLRVWVKKIEPWGKREIKGVKDYTYATGAGSRGVYVHFFLMPGIYQVNERISWQNARTYFIRVDDGTFAEITEQEALCLTISDTSAVPF